MWNRAWRKTPELSFAVPDYERPVQVTEANEKFVHIADASVTLGHELKDAEVAARVAIAEANREAAEARVTGTKPKHDPAKVKQAAEAKVGALRDELPEVYKLADTAGNELAHAIADNREKWLASLRPLEAEYRQAYADAIRRAVQAVNDFGAVKSAIEWLDEFDAADAVAGQQGQFVGGRPRAHVDIGELKAFDSEVDPTALLAIAARATEEPTPRTMQVVTHIAHSRFGQ